MNSLVGHLLHRPRNKYASQVHVADADATEPPDEITVLTYLCAYDRVANVVDYDLTHINVHGEVNYVTAGEALLQQIIRYYGYANDSNKVFAWQVDGVSYKKEPLRVYAKIAENFATGHPFHLQLWVHDKSTHSGSGTSHVISLQGATTDDSDSSSTSSSASSSSTPVVKRSYGTIRIPGAINLDKHYADTHLNYNVHTRRQAHKQLDAKRKMELITH